MRVALDAHGTMREWHKMTRVFGAGVQYPTCLFEKDISLGITGVPQCHRVSLWHDSDTLLWTVISLCPSAARR